MTGLMGSIAIKNINRAANKVLEDMITDNLKQFKLKDKEDIIINNPLYKAIVCILLSIFVAKISDIIFTSLLRRMANRTKTSIDDHIIDILHKPIYRTILILNFFG